MILPGFFIAGSSNGRITAFESVDVGSNPTLATKIKCSISLVGVGCQPFTLETWVRIPYGVQWSITQLVEYCPFKTGVLGSFPSRPTIRDIAQWHLPAVTQASAMAGRERVFHTHQVKGSTPFIPTKYWEIAQQVRAGALYAQGRRFNSFFPNSFLEKIFFKKT